MPKEWRGIIQVLKKHRPKLHYQIIRWEKSAQGKIKRDTDDVNRGNPDSSAYSLCLRDDIAKLMYAQAKAIGIKSNMKTEIIAGLEVITYYNKHKIRGVICEIDSLVIMKRLKKNGEHHDI